MTGKVRCRDCARLEHGRCGKWMKYMDPEKPRHCRPFRAKTQTTLVLSLDDLEAGA